MPRCGQQKKEKIDIAAHEVTKCYPLQQAVKMRRYGSLIKIKHSSLNYQQHHLG